MPEDLCIWDRLPGLNPEMSLEGRRAARIEPYETLASPTPPKGIADPEPYARDLHQRFANWKHLLRLHGYATQHDDHNHWIDRPIAAFLGALASILMLVNLLIFSGAFYASQFAIAVVAAVYFMSRWSLSNTLAAALRRRTCPTCRYDLRSTPSGIDPILLGADPGPRRCSECGSAWPLLPPRGPAEGRWAEPRRVKT